MKQILRIIKTTSVFWKYYLVTGIFVILISLLNLVNPILNKQIVDVIVSNVQNGKADFHTIVIILILIIVFDVLITLFTDFSGYIGDVLGQKLNTFLTSRFYKHVLDLEVEYFDNHITGEIMNKLQRGNQNISDFVNNMLNNFLPFFLTAFFTIVFMAFYSWQIALLLAVLFPLYIIISDKSSKSWIKKQGVINKIQDSAFGRVLESLASIRVVKSFLSEHLEFNAFSRKRKEIEKLTKVQSIEWHKFDVYRRLVLNFVLFGIYAYVIYYTFQGRYTIGEMTLLLQLVTQARFPLFAMSFILGQVQSAQAGSQDFFEVLALERKIKDKPGAITLGRAKGHVRFDKVSFHYGDNKNKQKVQQVLESITFSLKPGEKMAIVGESGGGKSTLANLLLRFYEPQKGAIYVDDLNILDITQESLHSNIAVVLQESLLFSGTIADNIAYGLEKPTQKQIEAAAKAANADEFIKALPDGFNSEIGERGIKLSGGQKQRISIARAILKDSPILILDEATSSLDSKAEREVQIALNKLMEKRTTIIIAHRLATIKSVNHIIVLKQGKIFEEGSPQSLLKRNGVYAELVRLQSAVAITPDAKTKKLKEFDLQA